MILFVWLLTVLCALAMVYHTQHLVHLYQLEGYKSKQFAMHCAQNRKDYLLRPVLLGAGALALELGLYFLVCYGLSIIPFWAYFGLPVVCALLFSAVLFIDRLQRKKQPQKKPLQYTKRVRRYNAILALLFCLLGLLVTLFTFFVLGKFDISGFFIALACTQGLYVVLLYPLFRLGMLLAAPLEKAIARYYFNDGKNKLRQREGLIKIGITGSYGKTSAKMILASILGVRYKVYATPASVNTPMGITRLIREELPEDTEVFIAEMGARQKGDIAELCTLVEPRYGIITSVGPQHLETFGDIHGVLATKLELAQGLPENGQIFINHDHSHLSEAYEKLTLPKGKYGIEAAGAFMSAWDISVDSRGSSFTLKAKDGASVRCTTRMLGRHNVLNITGCAALAYALGLSMEEIAQGIAKIEPVEHRLQLIPAPGRTVIDDAYNSNPVGARAALDVLALFEGRKIIITPGLVELGAHEENENRLLGEAMVGKVDVAILVARNAAALEQGLLKGGFDSGNIIKVGSLAAATAEYNKIARPGDVLLFENDLPDHYES